MHKPMTSPNISRSSIKCWFFGGKNVYINGAIHNATSWQMTKLTWNKISYIKKNILNIESVWELMYKPYKYIEQFIKY